MLFEERCPSLIHRDFIHMLKKHDFLHDGGNKEREKKKKKDWKDQQILGQQKRQLPEASASMTRVATSYGFQAGTSVPL